MSDARSARRTPGGRVPRRPGRTGGSAGRVDAGGTGSDAVALRSRPRFTGRALVVLLVLAALVASYASSLGAYLDQRRHVASLHEQIESSETAISDLRREKQRWRDDAYVVAQARARFAFGFPGEIGYQVLDEDGQPLGHEDSLSVRAETPPDQPEWWEATLESVAVAGDPPPARDAGPVEDITTPPDLRTPTE